MASHERRIRLVFDAPLGAGAFGTSAAVLAFYTLQNQDGLGPSTPTVAALILPGNANAVELAFGGDLAGGALYVVSAIGVPAVDTTVTDASSSTPFRFGTSQVRVNQEVPQDDYAALLYGVDLIHSGTDYLESSDGDLASVSGIPCVESDLRRGALSNGLLWDPTWGGFLRYYVDGVVGALPGAKQGLSRFFLKDDRVKAAGVTLITTADPTQATFDCQVTLIGAEILTAFSVQVPNT